MRAVYRRAPTELNRREWMAFCAAGFAVVLWGLLPLLKEQVAAVPPLLTAAVALAFAALLETLRGWVVDVVGAGADEAATVSRLPIGRGLALAALLVGAIAFFFAGLDRAPAAQVTLVTYTWPLMFVTASEILTHGRVRGIVLAGGAVAFAGSGVLITGGGAGAVSWDQGIGYLAGLLSGICWVGYSLVLRSGRTLGPGAWPPLFTLAAAGALVLHLVLEPAFAALSARTLAVCATIGAGPYGLAFVAWAYGVRCGPARTVGALAYAVPFVASATLIAAGSVELDWRFAVGAMAVVAGVVLANRQGTPA